MRSAPPKHLEEKGAHIIKHGPHFVLPMQFLLVGNILSRDSDSQEVVLPVPESRAQLIQPDQVLIPSADLSQRFCWKAWNSVDSLLLLLVIYIWLNLLFDEATAFRKHFKIKLLKKWT